LRIAAGGDNLLERVALRLNLVPVPAGYAMFGQAAGRLVGAAQKLGVLPRLVAGPASADALAAELGLQPAGTRLLCENLDGLEILTRRGDEFALRGRMRKWLDPASDTYVGTFLEHTVSYWQWFGDLERVLREGGSFEIHREPPANREYWRVYIEGQFEIARLSAREVARAIKLPSSPRRLLDVAGGHGWFAAELCRRHPGLRAVVLDLPGSAAIGREIIARAGMAELVEHREGDMFEADLDGPYDGALLFDILHHLSAAQAGVLLRRIREVLNPGAPIAVLDMFRSRGRRQSASAAVLGLFFHLTSGADLPDPVALSEQLQAAGFAPPRRTRIRRIPDQDLYQARAV
jgi:2-polyprenyl-3-methyl-5-hydroxy-6-metoxy-1,4-benzoquinol methylase